MATLRRSQHHQRRKAAETSSSPPRVFARPSFLPQHLRPRQLGLALDDAQQHSYNGSVASLDRAYALADDLEATAPPAESSSFTKEPLTFTNPSSSSPELNHLTRASSSYAPSPRLNPIAMMARPSSSSGFSSAGSNSARSRGSARSYLLLWYQDVQREQDIRGKVDSKRKLDLRVSRWLASLA